MVSETWKDFKREIHKNELRENEEIIQSYNAADYEYVVFP